MKSNTIRKWIELVIWLVLFGFPIILFPGLFPINEEGNINILFVGLSVTNLFLIGFYYLHYYFLIPRFYYTKKYFTYVTIVISYSLTMVLLLQAKQEFNPFQSPPFRFPLVAFVASLKMRFIMIYLVSLGLSSYHRLKKIEEEKLTAELAFLKAQINPHFLFNTLNSIYALSVKKSDKAPESVTKLSSIMRYVIADAKQDFVDLEKELNYIGSYIELEKLRLTSKVNLKYEVNGSAIGKQIAPLIFLPFIENAFKHGVSTQENSEINIFITIEKNQLILNVRNTKSFSQSMEIDKTGLGIENSKMRLKLLYPGKHELNIKNSDKEFNVDLKIRFND